MRQPVSKCISAVRRLLHSLSLPATDLRGRHPFCMKSHARLRAVNSRRPTAAPPRGKSRNSADARNGPTRPPPTAVWQDRYPAIVKLWRARWDEFVPSPGIPARSPAGDLHDEPESMNVPAAQGHPHPHPRPVPIRAGRPEGPLSGRAELGGIPPANVGIGGSGWKQAQGIHDLFRASAPCHWLSAVVCAAGCQPGEVVKGDVPDDFDDELRGEFGGGASSCGGSFSPICLACSMMPGPMSLPR
jgi:hypothetical protein